MEYIKETINVIKDTDGNLINFTSLINQYQGFQKSADDVKAQVQAIYALYPADVPAEAIAAFNLQS